ncbi:MAG: VOC family protein [Chloroflexota bacterium]
MIGLARFDIPVLDMERAVHFYSTVFDVEIPIRDTSEFYGAGGQYLLGMLIKQDGFMGTLSYHTSNYWETTHTKGPVIYLSVGNEDLTLVVDRVEKAGGEILIPITLFEPTKRHGYCTVIKDSEGNRIAIQSSTSSTCEFYPGESNPWAFSNSNSSVGSQADTKDK